MGMLSNSIHFLVNKMLEDRELALGKVDLGGESAFGEVDMGGIFAF